MASKNPRIQWIGIEQYKQKLTKLSRSKPMFEKEFLDTVGQMVLTMIRQVAPKDTGDYAKSWKIVKQTSKYIEIDTDQPDLWYWLEYGTQPHTIRPKNADALALPFGFFKYVEHEGTKPQPHLNLVVAELNNILDGVMAGLIKKHVPQFNHIQSRKGVRMPNARNQGTSKRVIGQTGTKMQANRGRRSTLQRATPGRLSMKRRIGRRRRVGSTSAFAQFR